MTQFKKILLTSILSSTLFVGCSDSNNSSNNTNSNNEDIKKDPQEKSEPKIALGTLNLDFANTGFVVHDNAAGGSDGDQGNSIALDSAGNIYVTGISENASNFDMVIWKYKADGTLDTSFDSDGIVVHDNATGGSNNDVGNSIALDSAGNIYVSGYSRNSSGNNDMVIWKYKADGTLDTSFDSDGFVVHANAAGGSSNDVGNSIALDSTGNIYVTGYSRNSSSNEDMVIWKYKANGSLDTSFASNGFVVHDNAAGGSNRDEGESIALDSAGNIYVSGYSRNSSGNYDMVIWKYKADGTLDTSFASNGFVVHHNAAGGSSSDAGNSIALDSSGNIYVTGYSFNSSSNNDMVIWKYKADGTLDTSFDSDGIVVHDSAAGGSGPDGGKSIVLDSVGNIYVTGVSVNASGNSDMAIWRYKADGSLDTSFASNGIVLHHGAAGGQEEEGTSITLNSAGNIYLTGLSDNGSNPDMVIWNYK